MRKLYILIFTLLPYVCIAQMGTLKGKLLDDLGYELIGCDIYLDDKMVATSNNSGEYTIEALPGTHKVTFKAFGFDDVSEEIEFVSGITITKDVTYKEDKNLIEEVVVSAGKFEQKISEITVSMAILKPNLIESKNTVSCEEIIEQVPGVNMQENQIGF